MSTPKKKSHWPLSLLSGTVSMLNLLLPLVLVRILSPEEVGRYKIFFLYLVLVPWFLMTAGITNGLGHFAGQEEDQRKKTFRASWTILSIAALLIGTVGTILSARMGEILGWSPLEAEIFVIGAVFTILGSFYEEALIASGKIWRGAMFSSGFEFLRTFGILAAALYFRTILAVFWVHVIGLMIKFTVSLFMSLREGFLIPNFNLKHWKPVFRYAIPVSMAAALQIITNYADQLLNSRLLTAAEFAIYSLGCLVIPPLNIFEQSVNRVTIPRLARLFATGQSKEACLTYRDMVSELAWFLLPAAVGLSLFAEPIVELLFTERYIESARFLHVYPITYLLFIIPYDAIFRARGDAGTILSRLAIFSAISLGLVLFFAKNFGAMGALVGALTGLALFRASSVVVVHQREGWRYLDMLPWRDLTKYLAWVAFAALAAWLSRSLFDTRLAWLVGGGIILCVIYFTGTAGMFLLRRTEFQDEPPVLLLTQYLGLGGLERMILNLSRGLQNQKRYTPIVLVYDQLEGNPTLHGEFNKSGVEVFTYSKNAGLSLKIATETALLVLRRKIPLIHSHDLGALIYAVLAKFMTLGGVRIVHTQHSFIHLEKHKRYVMYERFFTLFADEVTTVSQSLKDQYPAVGIDNSQIEVVLNGVEFPPAPVLKTEERLKIREALIAGVSVPEARPVLEAAKHLPWVLCMARIHPKKGQDHVVEVWRRLPTETKEKALLIFVGQETFSGQLAIVQGKIDSLGAHSHAVYAGFTLHPIPWLRACEISISGSEFEGMPLGPVEATGSGMKLLVSDISGHGILPSFVQRFPLTDPKAGASMLQPMIEEAARDSWSLRRHAWEQGADFRTNLGIQAMTLKYQAAYARAIR